MGKKKATLGERIRQRRERLGMAQSELCERLGVTASEMCDLEAGRRSTKRGVGSVLLGALADALGCTTDYLLGRDKPRAKRPARKP